MTTAFYAKEDGSFLETKSELEENSTEETKAVLETSLATEAM